MTPGHEYRVCYLPATGPRLRALLLRAREQGVWERVSGSLLAVERELGRSPAEWGDPVCRLAAAKLTTYRRVYDQLAVSYAPHDTERVLWITDVTPVLTHPLRS